MEKRKRRIKLNKYSLGAAVLVILVLCALLPFLNAGKRLKVVEEEAEESPVRLSAASTSGVTVTEELVTLTCTYQDLSHDVILCLPEKTKHAPLVLMLPGYGDSAAGFRARTAFDQAAVPKGYAVAYVTGAPDPGDSTSSPGWNSGIGASENNDVDFLAALANYLEKTYKLDRRRTYAVGYSNGAFMAHRLALEGEDTFEAVVSVAGMMPESIWENRPDLCPVNVFQITGGKDDVIPKYIDGSASHNPNPAIEDVMDYYVKVSQLQEVSRSPMGKDAMLTKYADESGKRRVWNLYSADLRHSWPDKTLHGIDTNQLILAFLEE